MRNEVELYINGQLVELGEDFEVNMTYTVEQTKNPTAIKNNYSKTVTIPATGKNNRIFSNIWNVTSIYNNDFDLTKKTDFQLFINGEKIEEGYIKIDRIKKTRTSANYECTLYGGLGDFFYSLSTNGEGGKLMLSDLDYGVEFDVIIDRYLVMDAWNALINDAADGTLYEHLNFALCYNGLPEDFSSDKVLISTYASGPYEIPYSISGYTSYNGWVLADLKQEYDEWASRDLRSYLQRPVFRVKTLINAICKPENNGGYRVNLDNDFFNTDNPYWEKTWITLPLINEMDEVPIDDIEIGINDIQFNRDVQEYYKIPIEVGSRKNIIIPFKLSTTAITTGDVASNEVYTGVLSLLDDGYNANYYNAPIAVQLVGYYKGTNRVGIYSDVEVFTSNKITDDTYSDGCLILNVGGTEKYHNGSFIKNEDTNIFYWEDGETFMLKISNIDDSTLYDWYIQVSRYEYTTPYYRNNYGEHYFDCVFLSDLYSGNGNLGTSTNRVMNKAYATNFNIEKSDDTLFLKNRILTKQRMLSSDKTPLDYLLGYTKQMGLYFIKHQQEKVIDIVTRRTFYGERNIIDLEELIDRGKEINITPLTFDKNWYDMGLEIEENRYSKIYDTYTDIPYGTKRIDTGYEYVKESTQLLNGNAYKAGLMVREKNPYMVNFRLPK